MTEVNETVVSAEEVVAALLANGGKYLDDHDSGMDQRLMKAAKYLGIFVNSRGEEHAFIGGDWDYFSINGVTLEDGVPTLGRSSVGGVILRKAGEDFHVSVLNFNCSQHDTAHVKTIWDVATGKKTLCHEISLQMIYPGYAQHNHDANGRVFVRREFKDTLTDKKSVSWDVARDPHLEPEHVFVRETDEAGRPVRYVCLQLFIDPRYAALGYSRNAQRDIDVIQESIDTFFKERPHLLKA